MMNFYSSFYVYFIQLLLLVKVFEHIFILKYLKGLFIIHHCIFYVIKVFKVINVLKNQRIRMGVHPDSLRYKQRSFPELRQVFLVCSQIIIKDVSCDTHVGDDRIKKQTLQRLFITSFNCGIDT